MAVIREPTKKQTKISPSNRSHHFSWNVSANNSRKKVGAKDWQTRAKSFSFAPWIPTDNLTLRFYKTSTSIKEETMTDSDTEKLAISGQSQPNATTENSILCTGKDFLR